MVETLLATASHYSPIVTWLMLFIGLANLLLNSTKNREVRTGFVAQRRYWPWLLIVIVATLVAWGPLILANAGWVSSSQEMGSVGGTADVNGGEESVGVKVALNMPYEAFCTTNWASSCYAQEKKDGLVILAFNSGAPPDGGKVEWRATPTPLLQAYHDEVNIVAQLRAQMGK
jgi:hypothetical protein